MERTRIAGLLCGLVFSLSCAGTDPTTALVVGGEQLRLGMPKEEVLGSILDPFKAQQVRQGTYLVTIGDRPDAPRDGILYFSRGELTAVVEEMAYFTEATVFYAMDALFVSVLGCTGGAPAAIEGVTGGGLGSA